MLLFSWSKLPLAAKFTTAMTTAILVAVAGISSLSIHAREEYLQKEIRQKGEILLNTVASISARSLETKNEILLKQIVADLESEDTIIATKIYNDRGQIVANINPIQPVAADLFYDSFFRQVISNDQAVIKNTPQTLLMGKVIQRDRDLVGAVTLELSTASVATEISYFRNRLILIAFFACTFGIGITTFVSQSLTKSLRKIIQFTSKMAQGDLSEPIMIADRNELGNLADSLNLVRGKIQQSIHNFEEDNYNLQSSEVQNNTLSTEIPELVWVLDFQGRIIDAKASAKEEPLTTELINKNIQDLFSQTIANEFSQAIDRAIKESTIQTFEYEWFIKNRRRYFEARILVCDLGSDKTLRNKVLAILRDNTPNKIAQEELQRVKMAAEIADVAKNQFLANMSHELRTPLNGILGLSDLLIAEAQEFGYTEIMKDLEQIQRSGTHLLTLIEDILDVAKLVTDKVNFHPEKFEIITLITEVRSLILPALSKNHNQIVIEDNTKLGLMISDRKRVKQILFNLLNNAAKFTHQGTITVSVSRQKRNFAPGLIDSRQLSVLPSINNQSSNSSVVPAFSDRPVGGTEYLPSGGSQTQLESDWIVFAISDTGIGMNEAEIKQIFQPFTQADSSTTKKYGGTGLGLTICKSFCEMMGGNIKVESTPGKGSTFTFWLPATLVTAPQIA